MFVYDAVSQDKQSVNNLALIHLALRFLVIQFCITNVSFCYSRFVLPA